MSDLNRASLLGRLGADPEMRSTQSGDKVANFSVATSEQWKDRNTGEKQQRTEWHRIVVFGPLASVAEKHLRKGARVHIEGTIRTRKWQHKDGGDRYSTEIVLSGFAASLNVIDWPDDLNGTAKGQDEAYGDNMPPGPQGDIDDSEIPF